MTPLQIIALVVGIPASVATFVLGGPAVWRLLCLPGQIDAQLHKLDQLDAISDAAQEARDEWKGATEAVRTLTDDHEGRISALEQWRRRMDRQAR